jgi:S-formylglutathione hydrolase FrmB
MTLFACKENFKIEKPSFTFQAKNVGTRVVRLILPSDYSAPSQAFVRYPTIYLLHGNSINPEAEFDDMAKTVKDAMEYLFQAGEVGKMIIVMPNAMITNERGNGSFYTDSPETGEFKTYVTPELVNLIDANYRTKKERSQRAITGGSMGGYGAIVLALQLPDNELFSSTASHSGLLCFEEMLDELATPLEPPLDDSWRLKFIARLNSIFSPGFDLNPHYENGELKYDREAWHEWLKHDPWTFLQTHPTAFDSFEVYIDCGSRDELGLTVHARKFVKKLDSLHVCNQFLIYESQTDTPLDFWDQIMSGHMAIKWHFAESLKFHWRHFNHSK